VKDSNLWSEQGVNKNDKYVAKVVALEEKVNAITNRVDS
jgi:hypothetical protein